MRAWGKVNSEPELGRRSAALPASRGRLLPVGGLGQQIEGGHEDLWNLGHALDCGGRWADDKDELILPAALLLYGRHWRATSCA